MLNIRVKFNKVKTSMDGCRRVATLRGRLINVFSNSKGVHLIVAPDVNSIGPQHINLEISKPYLKSIVGKLLASGNDNPLLDLTDVNCLFMERAYHKGRMQKVLRDNALSFSEAAKDNPLSRADILPLRPDVPSPPFKRRSSIEIRNLI